MNKREKTLLINVIIAMVITIVSVATMTGFKDWINRSEAMRAMEQLGRIVLQYRSQHGSVPPQSYVDSVRENLPGNARLGNLKYRARWFDFQAGQDEILAYSRKDFASFVVSDGYVVLRLGGKAEWMGKKEFEKLLASQQSSLERSLLAD